VSTAHLSPKLRRILLAIASTLLAYRWKYFLHSNALVKTAVFMMYLGILILMSHLSFRFFELRFIALKDRGIGRPAAS
jgi:hypothetical protein